MMISLLRSGGLLAVLALLPLGAAPVIGASPRLQTIVDGAVRATLAGNGQVKQVTP
jgi:hypothetical protein